MLSIVGVKYTTARDVAEKAVDRVFDLLGKEMMRKTYNNTNRIELDTQQFTTGVYIVNVKANTNKASLKLVVK